MPQKPKKRKKHLSRTGSLKSKFHFLLDECIKRKIFRSKTSAYLWLAAHLEVVNASKMTHAEAQDAVWNLQAKLETGHCLRHNQLVEKST